MTSTVKELLTDFDIKLSNFKSDNKDIYDWLSISKLRYFIKIDKI